MKAMKINDVSQVCYGIQRFQCGLALGLAWMFAILRTTVIGTRPHMFKNHDEYMQAQRNNTDKMQTENHGSTGTPIPFNNHMFKNHEEYVQAQLSKTDQILKKDASNIPNWVKREDVQFLARYMQSEMHLPFKHKFALAHGTRSGREQSWFMEFLPGMRVLGTELSPLAAGLNTVVMDFHEVKPEWMGQADFVYSNALDHSYNATFAVQQWMKEVSPEGVLIIEWSEGHTRNGLAGKVDIFGGTLQEFQDLIRNAGPFQIVAVVKKPTVTQLNVHYIFARHADHA